MVQSGLGGTLLTGRAFKASLSKDRSGKQF